MMQYDQIMAELTKELGLGSLPQEKQEELLVKMGELLMKRIFIETMERLGEDGAAEYEQLMEGNPEQSVLENFLNEKIPEYNEFIVKIVQDFKMEMKEAIIPPSVEAAAPIEEGQPATEEPGETVQDERITMLN